MAHSHDRNLVQALGIETDHKSPDHDLAVLYLQANAQRLADKVLKLSKPWNFTIAINDVNTALKGILAPHKQCERCRFWAPSLLCIAGIDAPESIQVTGTELEHQISKGEGKFQSLVGFLDLSVYAKVVGKRTYVATDYNIERICSQHQGPLTVPYAGRQHEKHEMGQQTLIVEVKTRPVPLGDAIRQISLYREYYRGQATWAFATTVPLEAAYQNALKNEDIHPILINEEYKHVKQTQAVMEML